MDLLLLSLNELINIQIKLILTRLRHRVADCDAAYDNACEAVKRKVEADMKIQILNPVLKQQTPAPSAEGGDKEKEGEDKGQIKIVLTFSEDIHVIQVKRLKHPSNSRSMSLSLMNS